MSNSLTDKEIVAVTTVTPLEPLEENALTNCITALLTMSATWLIKAMQGLALAPAPASCKKRETKIYRPLRMSSVY